MAKDTAQQQLLKMIEASGGGSSPAKLVKPKKKPKSKVRISIKQLNALLILAVIVTAGFLVVEMIKGQQLLSQNVRLDYNGDASANYKSYVPNNQSLVKYADRVSQRNIFAPFESGEKTKVAESVERTFQTKMSKFNLVGIAWMDMPDTASIMLEDSKSGLTYFLTEGDKIEDVTVKTIYVDRAVFSYKNEEIVIEL